MLVQAPIPAVKNVRDASRKGTALTSAAIIATFTGTADASHVLAGNGTLISATGGSVTQGVFASRPGTGGVNDIYVSTDGPLVSYGTGSGWNSYLRGETAGSTGLVSTWTQTNFGGLVTATDVGGGITLEIQNTTALNWRLLTKTAPATPYHIQYFMRSQTFHTNSDLVGVYFYDGTKLMGLEFVSQTAGADMIRVEKMNSVTSDNTTAINDTVITFNPFLGGVWLRLGNNGTTLTFDYALQQGGPWKTLFSEAVGTFITPTSYGFGGLLSGSTGKTILCSVQGINITA